MGDCPAGCVWASSIRSAKYVAVHCPGLFGRSDCGAAVGGLARSAIALGSLTTLLFSDLVDFSRLVSSRSQRRRWHVRPESPSDRSKATGFRPPTQEQRRETRWSSSRRGEATKSSRVQQQSVPRDAGAAEDWQTWGERVPASQWEDWSQTGNADPAGSRFSRRQSQERDTASGVVNDLDRDWDDSARDTVYVPPGGSSVEDALDDIAEGWEDWEAENKPRAETAYSYGYGKSGSSSRIDSVYGPPDDAQEPYGDRPPAEGDRDEDWGLDEPSPVANATDGDSDTQNSDGVYDADYRVIIPPHRPIDTEDENERDRTP